MSKMTEICDEFIILVVAELNISVELNFRLDLFVRGIEKGRKCFQTGPYWVESIVFGVAEKKVRLPMLL